MKQLTNMKYNVTVTQEHAIFLVHIHLKRYRRAMKIIKPNMIYYNIKAVLKSPRIRQDNKFYIFYHIQYLEKSYHCQFKRLAQSLGSTNASFYTKLYSVVNSLFTKTTQWANCTTLFKLYWVVNLLSTSSIVLMSVSCQFK